MFTGIVAGFCTVSGFDSSSSITELTVHLGELGEDLIDGASVSVNGVCLTAANSQNGEVLFYVVPATSRLTNLRCCTLGSAVNVERSLTYGSEIGGHVLSGHISDVVTVVDVDDRPDESAIRFEVPTKWNRYLFAKGFIALNGVSLTLAEFDRETGVGLVNLIPDTLKRTNLGSVSPGDLLNLEIDSQTQSIVETTENFLRQHLDSFKSMHEH